MKDRVVGIETEYAVVYFPARGEPTGPTNLSLYPLFEAQLARRVASVPRALSLLRSKPGRFLANGMSFHYEATPQAFEHGLLEIASPECRDPFTLVVHEAAKDALAAELREAVNRDLEARGWRGEVRLLKNNVDSQGHTFGSHESYWIDDPLPLGRRLALAPLWALTWLATLPVLVWLVAVSLALAALPLALLLAPLLGLLVGAPERLFQRRAPGLARRLRRAAGRLRDLPARVALRLQADPAAWVRRLAWVEWPFRLCMPLHAALYARFFFRPVLRGASAFLATRVLFAGAGAVDWSNPAVLRLGQRAPHLKTLAAIFTSGERRPMIELRDPFFRPWSAFGRRRRLHLMLGDANLCEWALALRVGSTCLVLEALEKAPDGEWPALSDPLASQLAVSSDPEVRLPMRDGGTATALQIQWQVLDRVREVLGVPREEWKRRMLAMWEETLSLLERDPDALADRIDWLAKQQLLRREVPAPEDWEQLVRQGGRLVAAPAQEHTARLRELAFRVMRADLRYHELGPRGGHQRLRQRGAVRVLSDPADVAAARTDPPADTRARARGQGIREAAALGAGAATWHRVRVGWLDWRFFLDPLG